MTFGHFNQINDFYGIGKLVSDDVFHKGSDLLIDSFEFEVTIFPSFILFFCVEVDAWKFVAQMDNQLSVSKLGCLVDLSV